MRILNFDTETVAMIPGSLTPPMACLTWTERVGDELTRNILSPRDGIEWLRARLECPDDVLGGQNVTFDLGVTVEEAERQFGQIYAQELLALIFRALRDGRISDVMMRESLLLLADGVLSSHPGEGNRKPGTSLADIARRRLGLDLTADKKNPDAWRLRYGELVGVPIDLWPADAVRYAVDDPRIQLLCWEHQLAEARDEDYLDQDQPWLVVDEGRKIATAWSLHLCSCRGMRTDPERVELTAARIEEAGRAVERLLLSTGLGEQKSKQGVPYVGQRRKVVQQRVAAVYAGLGVDRERLLELSSDSGDEDEDDRDTEDDSGDLTEEQGRILDAIVRTGGEAIRLPDVSAVPDHLEPYPLVRFTWGTPKTPEQVASAEEHRGMVCFDREGLRWAYPWSKESGIVAGKCSGQIITKITSGGGGVAYKDTWTGEIVTPLTSPSKSFPEGQVAWSREVLEQSGDPVLLLLAALGRVTKLRTTYVPQLVHGTVHPIQPRYWLPKESGRTSASGPNVQNLPTFGGIRECFVARPGWALLDADINRAECVAWAQWCLETLGFSQMGDVILSGKDVHTWTAIHFPQVQGMNYEEAEAKIKAGDPFLKELRKAGKSGVFAWMGGAGPDTIVKIARGGGFEMTRDQAVDIIAVLNKAYPEGKLAARWVSDRCPGDSTFTFEQRVSGRRRGGCGYTDGRNQPFQGGIADHTGDVLFHIVEECYTGKPPKILNTHIDTLVGEEQFTSWWSKSGRLGEAGADLGDEYGLILRGYLSPLYGARLWAYVHDEFILEVPYDTWGPERTTLAARRLEQIIVGRGAFWFPDIPMESTAACARRWIKDRKTGKEIKQTFDADGFLIPCDDVPVKLLS